MPLNAFSCSTLRRLLLLVLLFCFCRVVWTSRHIKPNDQSDFFVYKTASSLILQGMPQHIYDGADTGLDPQLKLMPTETVFSHVAVADGISKVMMYVYPPILSDMLLPFALMPAPRAAELWFCCNLIMLGGVSWLASRLLAVRWTSRAGITLTLGLISLFSVAVALEAGQITIFLLLLWMLSLYFYQRDLLPASALTLALASTIKLTPLIAVVPFMLWRQGRWLRAFALCTCALVVIMMLVNSPASIADYVLRVTPAMSRGVAHPENRSISSVLQMVYLTRRGQTMNDFKLALAGPVPHSLLLLGKLLPMACLAAATVWGYLRARAVSREEQLEVLAAFALLSVVVSPVSWAHAYVVAYPLLILMWRAALQQRLSRFQTGLLLFVSLDLGGLLINDVGRVALKFSDIAAAYVLLLGPVSAMAAVFLCLQVASHRRPEQKSL